MNLSVLPPSDLLRQVEGIERGLRKQRRLGAVGWLGLAVAILQATVVVVQSDFWEGLLSTNWHDLLFGTGGQGGLLDQWPFLLALAILLASVLLIAWKRFWLQESREPFRYTFAVDEFTAITKEDPSLVWLRHHLSERLNQRISRLSILEDEAAPADAAATTDRKRGAPGPRYESHIHIRGHYGTRIDRDRWIIEIVPRVRVGPKGSAETMAHPEIYQLNPVSAKTRDGRTRRTSPDPLSPEDYEKLLERVYFSVATEIYRQITRDVQHKIDLLPTNYLRATAYLHEAEDYARSDTLVAFDEAERLFQAAIRLYDPARRPWPTSVVRWPGHLLRQVAASAVGYVRRLVAFAWGRAARTDLMVARAQTGYANVLLDRRSLAGMSGYRLNPIFESRPVAGRAVHKLDHLPRDVAGVTEGLFEAHVTLALSWAYIGSLREARAELEEARRLLPTRAPVDARFAYAAGVIETRPRSKQLQFQRAIELDPTSEAAQFALAFEGEKLWRTKQKLEADVAQSIVDEYELVLTLNPGNIAAWGNLGYIQWLLAEGDERAERLDRAREYFERGRDYKEIKRETYVVDLDYGLARIAAETGEFNRAYKYFTSALTAHMTQATPQSYAHGWSSLSEYLFLRIDLPILQRFESYRQWAERFHGVLTPNVPERVRDSVLAFVTNDYGEACYNYYRRSSDRRYLERARAAYLRSAELDRSYVIPRHNLFLLNKTEGYPEAERDADELVKIEPDWSETKLAIMWRAARNAAEKQRAADLMAQERRESLHRIAAAILAGTDEERESVVFEPAQTEALSSQLTPYEKSRKARSKTTEAEMLWRHAIELAGHRRDLLLAAQADRHQAQSLLRNIVPHHWLWRGRLRRYRTPEMLLTSRAMAWHRLRLGRESRWERELDNVQVQALYNWGLALFSPASRWSPSDRVFAHIEEHFWLDDFDILQHFREQADRRLQNVVLADLRIPLRTLQVTRTPLAGPSGTRLMLGVLLSSYLARLGRLGNAELRHQRRLDTYNQILQGVLRARLNDDPTGYWALSGLSNGFVTVTRWKAVQLTIRCSTFDWKDRRDYLLQVLDGGQPRHSPALYQWVGDQLEELRREADNRRTLADLLEKTAQAIGRQDERAAEMRKVLLESRQWNGLDASTLAACRRALRAREPEALHLIARRLHLDVVELDRLRELEVRAYEQALRSDDPKLLWEVAESLQRLGEQELSRQALKASVSWLAREPPDATTLWDLAKAYKKLGDWTAARETFQRALQADPGAAAERGRPARHTDLHRWEIARARWGEGSYAEALDELELVTGDALEWQRWTPDRERPAVWTRFVAELLNEQAVRDQEAYRELRLRLERRQRAGPDAAPARRDAGLALLRLARARPGWEGRAGGPVRDWRWDPRETLPVVSPIMLHADSALFPDHDALPVRELTAAYTRLSAEIETQTGIHIPGVLIRASEDDRYKGRRYVVKLHEIPLRSGTASRNHTEQRIVSEGISPVVQQYLDTYLGFAEVGELLDRLATASASREARRAAAALSSSGTRCLRLVQVLQRLLRESVPLTEPEAILEAFDRAPAEGEVDEVVDRVRKALVERLPRTAPGIGLGPAWEATVQRWVQHGEGKRFLAIPVGEAHLRQALLDQIDAGTAAAPGAIVVVSDELRRFVHRLLAPRFPFLPVLALGEWAESPAALQPLEAPQPQPEGVG